MKPMRNVPDLKFEPDWRRLKFVIEQSGLSEEQFADFVKLEDPGIITHIRYAQCGIDEELARKIHGIFPQYSTEWLRGEAHAQIPKPANLFPKVKVVERMNYQAFEQLEAEFRATAEGISRALIRAIPCDPELRTTNLEELYGDIRHLLDLLENMRRNMLPATRERMKSANRLCDDLCSAAQRLGLPL